MKYPKHFSTSRSGFILVDIILGLSLTTFLVFLITASSLEAREVFESARNRSAIIDAFEQHAYEFGDLMPYESRSRSYAVGTTSDIVDIDAVAKWFGNDRIETDIKASLGSTSVMFASVRVYPYVDMKESAGTPLCSPDLLASTLVGSYGFFSKSEVSSSLRIKAITLPVNPLLPLTDIVVRGDIAYVSTDSTVASDPDLYILNISDRSRPIVLSSINTGPGIAAIALASKYIYAAAASTAAQLHVIRLDSLYSPVLAKKYQLPLPQSSTTPPFGSSIFYDRGKVYLGTEKWDEQEFSVIDVTSPENPAKLSGFETGSKVNSIYVHSGLAYVAASDQLQLRTLDLTNPLQPLLVSYFSPSGWSRQEGRDLSYFEDALDFGRTSGGFNITVDHELFRLGRATTSLDIPGGVYGIIRDRHHVYAATRDMDHELSVFDPLLTATSSVYYSLPVLPQAMTCDGYSLFILAKTAPVIYEITSIP